MFLEERGVLIAQSAMSSMWSYHCLWSIWPVRCQIHGCLPSRRATKLYCLAIRRHM